MDLSIVLPVWNARDTLADTAASALALRGVSFELIIVDDGSSDETDAMISGLTDPGIRTLALSVNMGVSFARNAGMEHACGDYVTFLNAGDTLRNDSIARIVREARAMDVDIAVGAYRIDVRDDMRAFDAEDALPFQSGFIDIPAGKGMFHRDKFAAMLDSLLENDLFHPVTNKIYKTAFPSEHIHIFITLLNPKV